MSYTTQRPMFPQYDVGEPFLIEPDDQSPFQKFGFVRKGQVVQALYNNLIRVPIFRQKAYHSDFLVVRCVFLRTWALLTSEHGHRIGAPLRESPSITFERLKQSLLRDRHIPYTKYLGLIHAKSPQHLNTVCKLLLSNYYARVRESA